MNNIAILFNKIYQFYQNNFVDLRDKQFHFASRLYLWNQDPFYKQKLEELAPEFLQVDFLNRDYTSAHGGLANFDEQRLRQLEKFPQLLKWHDVLIQALYAQTVFHQDIAESLNKIVQTEEVLTLEKQLLADQDALARLSTYATSFLFLWRRFFLRDETGLDLNYLLEVGLTKFESHQPSELSLQIYYLTHCVIGETLFYSRRIPSEHLGAQKRFLITIEKLIDSHFFEASLDHKLEFLLCCRLLNHSSHLEVKIMDEVQNSLSDQGDFLVDRRNYYQPTKGNFNFYQAEHKNVLFLMLSQPSTL